MKKLVLVLAVCVALTSCTQRKVTHDDWQSEHDKRCGSRITKFNYEGHSYLLFENGHQAGITHDANCECRYEFCDE